MPTMAEVKKAINDFIEQRMFDEALLYLDGVSKENGKLRPLIEYLRGQTYIAKRDFRKARIHYQLSFENELRIPAAEMIAALDMAQGQIDNAIQFLEETIVKESENLRMLRFDLCKFYVITHRTADAERIMGDILPGLAPPLQPLFANEAQTLRAAIGTELDSLDGFPNIKSFLDLVEGNMDFSSGVDSGTEGAIAEDVPGT